MSKVPKTLLCVSAIAFLASLTNAGSELGWGFLKPLSAILLIAFFILQFLEKEVAQYDEENRSRLARAKRYSPDGSDTSKNASRRSPRRSRVAIAH
jgi:hypothetical protein